MWLLAALISNKCVVIGSIIVRLWQFVALILELFEFEAFLMGVLNKALMVSMWLFRALACGCGEYNWELEASTSMWKLGALACGCGEYDWELEASM